MWKISKDEKRILLFSEFILTEVFKPVFTEYGTDFKNQKFRKMNKGFYVTFFKSKKSNFIVFFHDGFVGFDSFSFEDTESVLNYDTIEEIFKHSNFKKTDTFEAVDVFDSFLYVMKDIVEKYDLKEIKFDGADKKLVKLYDMLVRNKKFLKEIEKLGFEYNGKITKLDREFYLFTKSTSNNK